MAKTFEQAQQDLNLLLKPIVGRPKTKEVEQEAQLIVDAYFRKLVKQRNRVTIEPSGLEITGARLAFHIGSICIGEWKTSFYPEDRFSVAETEVNPIALGYVNGCQLYILPGEDEPGRLVARAGMGEAYEYFIPSTMGLPLTNSIFFVALERARVLGYLYTLQTSH